MESIPLFALYLAPAGFVLLYMIRKGSFSAHHISSLRRLPKRITLEEWLVVCGYLGISLETKNQPPVTKPGKPWRLIWSGVGLASSLVLFQVILPLNVPLSFDQRSWNAFPAIQAAVAGMVLASSLMLAFHRPRRWLLIEHHKAAYPYLRWDALRKAKGKTT